MPNKEESTWASFDLTSWAQQRLAGKYDINYKEACPANDVEHIFTEPVESTFVDAVRGLSTASSVQPPVDPRADDAPRAYAEGEASVQAGEVMAVFGGDGVLCATLCRLRAVR
jgi:hypothetical protein